MNSIKNISEKYGITEATAKQFLKYGVRRAKYGVANAKINKPQMKALEKKGYVIPGYFGTVQKVTDEGIKLFEELHNAS